MNGVIYVAMFLMVGVSISIVIRRLRGAIFNLRHLSRLEDAANDDRTNYLGGHVLLAGSQIVLFI